MPCPVCGDICRCASRENDTDTDFDTDKDHFVASPRWQPDADISTEVTISPALPEPPQTGCEPHQDSPAEAHSQAGASQCADEPASSWRLVVAARLNRYQARRKPRPPRYPSLRLPFDPEVPAPPPGRSFSESSPGNSSGNSSEPSEIPPRPDGACAEPVSAPSPIPSVVSPPMRVVSNQALALDEFLDSSGEPEVSPAETASPAQETAQFDPARRPTPAASAKIIEFPRSWTPAPPPPDQLAEPVLVRPRILEAPEVVPPPPALGGITIEPAPQPLAEKRPGVDTPVQRSPLLRRLLAALIDYVIIALACGMFGFVFWKVTAIRPPRFQLLCLASGLSGLFWATYQYLLVVYSGATPGLRLARLQVARFDGSPAGRSLRRWRVLASFLSAASLGMGYAWVFLDEDSLCWHDRITHTCLAPKV